MSGKEDFNAKYALHITLVQTPMQAVANTIY